MHSPSEKPSNTTKVIIIYYHFKRNAYIKTDVLMSIGEMLWSMDTKGRRVLTVPTGRDDFWSGLNNTAKLFLTSKNIKRNTGM